MYQSKPINNALCQSSFAPTVAKLSFWGLITAGVAFVVSHRFWKLEGWRLYSTAAGAGVVGALASSVLLLPKATEDEVDPDNELLVGLSQDWLSRFDNTGEISEEDKKILAQLQIFRPQWFDEIKEDNIIKLLKQLPNLKTLSFLRISKGNAIIDVEFQDLDGLLDPLFSNSHLKDFVPNESLLKKMSAWDLGDLTPAQKNCLSSITGFALSDSSNRATESALAKLLPYLPNLQWLNLEKGCCLERSSVLFQDPALKCLKNIPRLILSDNYIIEIGKKLVNKEELIGVEQSYISLCTLVDTRVDDNVAIEILKNAPNLRLLRLEKVADKEMAEELLKLVEKRVGLQFFCGDSIKGSELEKWTQDYTCIFKSDWKERLNQKKVHGLRRIAFSVKSGGFSSQPNELQQEIQGMSSLAFRKHLQLCYTAENDNPPDILNVIIKAWSPSSFAIFSSTNKKETITKKGLEVLESHSYQIRAQNIYSQEICPLSQTGIEAWEGLDWKKLKADPELLLSWQPNIQGVRFVLVLVAPDAIFEK